MDQFINVDCSSHMEFPVNEDARDFNDQNFFYNTTANFGNSDIMVNDRDDNQQLGNIGNRLNLNQQNVKENSCTKKVNEEMELEKKETASRMKTTRKWHRAHAHIMNAIEECNALGFVFGVIIDGQSFGDTSDSLTGWWKDEVNFELNGPASISKNEDIYDMIGCESSARVSRGEASYSLDDLHEIVLGSIISVLMPHCEPPQKKFPFKAGIAPPWWPTRREEWWNQLGLLENFDPPAYKKPGKLKKDSKICILTAIIKHMMPDFRKLESLVRLSKHLQGKMATKDRSIWSSTLNFEVHLYIQQHPEAELLINCQEGNINNILSSNDDHGHYLVGHDNGNKSLEIGALTYHEAYNSHHYDIHQGSKVSNICTEENNSFLMTNSQITLATISNNINSDDSFQNLLNLTHGHEMIDGLKGSLEENHTLIEDMDQIEGEIWDNVDLQEMMEIDTDLYGENIEESFSVQVNNMTQLKHAAIVDNVNLD